MNYESLDSTKTYFITGAAGFVGYLSKKLLDAGCDVIGIDNLNDYYDVNLKQTRLNQLKQYGTFIFFKGDISDKEALMDIFETYKPDIVVGCASGCALFHRESGCIYPKQCGWIL